MGFYSKIDSVRDQPFIFMIQRSIPRRKNTEVFTLNQKKGMDLIYKLFVFFLEKDLNKQKHRIQLAAWGTHPILPLAKEWIHLELKTVNEL